MKEFQKFWAGTLSRPPASVSELVGLIVLVLSLLLLLVLSILTVGLILAVLVAGLHLVRILILHQAHLAFAASSVTTQRQDHTEFFAKRDTIRSNFML